MNRALRIVPVIAPLVLAALAPPLPAGDWNGLQHQPPGSANTMLLLTDGRVLCNDGGGTHWMLLTPDSSGSYVHGTWSTAAYSNYDRLYFASAVLADGRVIVSGGEYSGLGGSETSATEIYDPVADTWTVIAPPSGWSNVGDAPASVLADGRWLLGSIFNGKTALFDPLTDTWTAGPNKRNGSSTEETWLLMPDGSVLSWDCIGHPGSERFDPVSSTWVDCGSTPVDLVEAASAETGPGALLPDGTAFCMGATPHCCIYTLPAGGSGTGTWLQGGDPPLWKSQTMGAKDGPCAALPNGNVLCALGPVDGIGGDFLSPTVFYVFNGTDFHRASDPPNNAGPPFVGRMLVLPTGEVAFAAGSIYLFTPNGGPQSAWLPTVTSVPADLLRGRTHPLAGTQLNGITQGASYGDDAQGASNYPLVRLTNVASGHVRYCRTHGHSSMGVATGAATVTTNFDVPADAELGDSLLEVVANGIASTPVSVVVRDALTIDFDDLASHVQVTTQYPLATFSSDPGFATWTEAQSLGNSLPNTIGGGPAGSGPTGFANTYVDFTFPVVGLSFRAIGVDNWGPVATVNVFENGTQTGTVSVIGLATPDVPVTVDLSAFHDVTRIELVGIADQAGISWDDFVFGADVDAAWTNYGAGYPGTLGIPALVAESDPVLDSPLAIDIGNSLGATTPGFLLIGLSQASIPTSKGGTLLVSPLIWLPLSIPGAGLTLDGGVADDPALLGLHVDLQVIEADGGAAKGFSFSAGLDLAFGY